MCCHTNNHEQPLQERDPVRGNDSFAALEEIFIRAKEYKVNDDDLDDDNDDFDDTGCLGLRKYICKELGT